MKLLAAGASPYVSKVAMAAHVAGVAVETVNVDATNGDAQLDAANPLSKIPCLVTDDGNGIFDSRGITRYLDRVSGGKLYPSEHEAATREERWEALADGMSDCTVGYMYELRFHPAEKVEQEWLDRLWNKAERAMKVLGEDLPPVENPKIGALAIAAALGYLDLRFAGKWETGNEALTTWRDAFFTAHPDLAALKPHA